MTRRTSGRRVYRRLTRRMRAMAASGEMHMRGASWIWRDLSVARC